jgi:uncharacterized membrane protein YqgA involved in biofilm formation
MFVGLGTLINVAAIILGTFLGILVGKRFREETRELVTQAMGFITLIAAADALTEFWKEEFQTAFGDGVPLLIILASLAIGALIGSALRIEERISRLGEGLKVRYSSEKNPRFVEGFLAASVLFVVGPMAILGSISDGLGEGIELLILKSTLDFFIAIAFTTSFGWSVGLSVIPVALYQFSWTLVGLSLGEVLNEIQVIALTIVGGTLLLGIALFVLGIKRIAVGNLLPALLIAPIVVAILARS